ncbi:uncharacterized protein EV154DRAFT_425064 [Mucor mucedo]|uniref:uncharacterized protein n=1 Tax=Mucor mucedo TaxID=29922 RepID=UPI002221200E|nr:uncharacterized protein EV154DRAFT_425064 [Mucor mucedo]KAI7888801.1 hypothetical protein EV154DRAFT_425064 [Mucor mucedo]
MSLIKTKSILKKKDSSSNNSWFSKLEPKANANVNSPTSPRINNLFNGLRKQPQSESEQPNVNSELDAKELRRVRFPVASITKEYLFMKEDPITERKSPTAIEPINIQTLAQLLSLYELVCRNKQVQTIDLLVSTLINQQQTSFLTRIDLTNQHIDRYNIEPLADIMSVEFGLQELVLNNCGLEDDAIKVLMHSLLNNDKITQLNLANNPKITAVGFKYIAVYIKGVRSTLYIYIQYLLFC